MVFAKSLFHTIYCLLTSKVIKSLQTGCILHVADSGQIKDAGILNPPYQATKINQINSVTGKQTLSSELASSPHSEHATFG
jgi:hypothetical protein